MKFSKKIILAITALSLTFAAAGCTGKTAAVNPQETGTAAKSSDSKTAQYPMTIKDSNGDEVTIDKEPAKVVSLGPNITETIFAIGAGSKLVGRTDYCDYPEEAKKVQAVGNLTDPSIEKITELKPDLVFASTHVKPEVEKKLKELGIKVVYFYSEDSFDGVYKTIGDMGKILNAQQGSDKVVADMKAKVAMVQDKVKGLNKPTLYYVVGYGKSQFTAGKDTFIGKMIEMAGAKNAADDVTGWSYSLEKLVEKNPDMLVCSKNFDSKKGIQAADGYKDLKAVKEGRLYEIDENILNRQGPRLADGLYELAKIVHPEAFK
jgi:iron complex transport system substrate-binding protein